MSLFKSLAPLVRRPAQSLTAPFTRTFSCSTVSRADFSDYLDRLGSSVGGPPKPYDDKQPLVFGPHRLHVFSTKHNTHLTLTQAPRKDPNTGKQVDVLMSLSAGNIGFKKAGRGTYDAAYQLAAFVLKQIQERGLLRDLNDLEVVMRGFGKGREAVAKCLLGSEGYLVRNKIRSIKDSTRLKFGGSRSPKPRRLG